MAAVRGQTLLIVALAALCGVLLALIIYYSSGERPADAGKASQPEGGVARTAAKPGDAGHAGAAMASAAQKDGATLRTYLAGSRSVTPADDPIKAGGTSGAITDARVVKQLLQLLGPDQKVRGNRKQCFFQFQLVFRGKGGSEQGMVGVCAPVKGARAAKGALMEPKQGVEYEITVPRVAALAALVKKHLPQAFCTDTSAAGWLRKHLEENPPEPAR